MAGQLNLNRWGFKLNFGKPVGLRAKREFEAIPRSRMQFYRQMGVQFLTLTHVQIQRLKSSLFSWNKLQKKTKLECGGWDPHPTLPVKSGVHRHPAGPRYHKQPVQAALSRNESVLLVDMNPAVQSPHGSPVKGASVREQGFPTNVLGHRGLLSLPKTSLSRTPLVIALRTR